MNDSITEPAPVDYAAPPLHTEDVHCPLCEYDLRGLSDPNPRCPECGYSFTWAELRDPRRRAHPFLFEHHPSRNLWSFFRTITATCLPRRFWASLYPSQRSRPRRLIWYFLWANVGVLLFIASALVSYGILVYQSNVSWRASMARMLRTPTPYGGIITSPPPMPAALQQQMDRDYPLPPSPRFFWNVVRETLFDGLPLYLWLLWPALLMLTLMIFRVSMRRARVNPVHVMRCVIYSGDFVFWLTPVLLPAAALLVAVLIGWAVGRNATDWMPALLTLIFLIYSMVMAYRLAIAFRRYLRFEHAIATIFAVHVIALLVVLVVEVNLSMGRWWGYM
jgi:hypothetical protein